MHPKLLRLKKYILPDFSGSVRLVLILSCAVLLLPSASHGRQTGPVDHFFQEIKLLAESGDAEAQYSLAMMYEFGDHVRPDRDKAFFWLRKAAEQNLAAACYALGIKYEAGSTVPPSLSEAARWYRRAALQDLPMAQFHLGLLLLPGSALQPDPVQAYAWLTLAAEHGYPEAQANRNIAVGLLGGAERSLAEALTRKLREEIRRHRYKP